MIAESSDPNNIFEKRMIVSFIGEFKEFALFLNTLERHKPVFFINEFVLSRQNGNDMNYQVTLDVTALVRKQNTEIQDAKNDNVFSFND